MVLNKDEFLKEYNIDEKFLIDNNIDWNELEKIYNDYFKQFPAVRTTVRNNGSWNLHKFQDT